MINIFHKKKKTVADKVSQETKKINPEIKEMFVGRNTIFSLMGMIVGGVLFGSSLWVYSSNTLGLYSTMALGIVIFLAAGVASKAFRK